MASPATHPESALSFSSPAPNAKFFISHDAVWPSMLFQTNAQLSAGQELTWEWTLHWLTFSQHGVAKTNVNSWDAKADVENLGGTLTVQVTGPNGAKALLSVLLLGTQPDVADVSSYLNANPNSSGFDKILNHETSLKHFDATGYPKKSFDNGYGMAQLTNPAPSFTQVWNWKQNIDAGLVLFGQKRALALAYLSQGGRSYTDDQLQRETISRWNGGPYHTHDPQAGWVRNPHILCDSQTSNIGWDLTDSDNKGKTEAELHARDASAYRHAPAPDASWGYFGVCYADRILGA